MIMCRIIYSIVILSVIFLTTPLTGCKKVFQYNPYSAQLAKGYDGIRTDINLSKLRSNTQKQSGSLKIALLADTHYHLGDLRAAIDAVNRRDDIHFTVIAGDLSDQGLEKEYLLLYDELKRLETPLFTVIGNHDYLANASIIYQKMFGPYNYSFSYAGKKFIFFDSNIWEKNGEPDLVWLRQELEQTQGNTPILISHIAPYSDQYSPELEQQHLELVRQYGLELSIHGHDHHYRMEEVYGDGTMYLQIPSIEKRTLCILSFEEGVMNVQLENF